MHVVGYASKTQFSVLRSYLPILVNITKCAKPLAKAENDAKGIRKVQLWFYDRGNFYKIDMK